MEKKELSPVDQYVKRIVVEDTLYLMSKSLEKLKEIELDTHYFSYKKILENESEDIQEMKLI